MLYLLKYSPKAVEDLDEIYYDVFNASKSLDITNKYINGLIDAVSEKKLFPFSGIPLLYKGLATGFYSVNYKKYKAFYRINGQSIEVLRIILAKKDYMSVLFEKNNEEE